MPPNSRSRLPRALCAVILAFGAAGATWADGDRRTTRVPLLPQYKEECGACHVAYPPGMLPAASWQRVMANLQRHYGADATLDAATARTLATWLDANAGTWKRVREEPPADRITGSAWFIRKHDGVPLASWKLPAVKSAANCVACHPQADLGDFNEHNVRIPR